MSKLFREQAIKHQVSRLQGDVILTLNPKWRLVCYLSCSLIVLFICAAFFITRTYTLDINGVIIDKKKYSIISTETALDISKIFITKNQILEHKQNQKILAFKNSITAGWYTTDLNDTRFDCLQRSDIGESVCYFEPDSSSKVYQVFIEVDSKINKHEPVFSIQYENAKLIGEFILTQDNRNYVQEGQKLAITLPNFPGREFLSTVQKIKPIDFEPESPMFVAGITKYKVLIDISQNQKILPNPELGMSFESKVIKGKESIFDWLFNSNVKGS